MSSERSDNGESPDLIVDSRPVSKIMIAEDQLINLEIMRGLTEKLGVSYFTEF